VLELLAASHPEYFTTDEAPILPPFVRPPKLVHRLDAPVSGAFVMALSDHAARQFGRNLKYAGTNRGSALKKTYVALLEDYGETPLHERLLKQGLIREHVDQPSGHHDGFESHKYERIWQGVVESPINGKPATTQFWLRESCAQQQRGRVLVAFEPVTGRKHQLRIHAAEVLGSPILGDTRYGGTAIGSGAIALHAAKLDITFGRSQFSVLAPFEWNRPIWQNYIGKDRLLLDSGTLLNRKKVKQER
jgi:tRNA pseudouridine32 synthase/23S rRNA pseudouridine746 synthase